jgi:hypothetical protein
MTVRCDYHTATLLASRQVLVAGGQNSFSGVLSSAELFDPGLGTWTANWSILPGSVAEVSHGAFQFTDTQATNYPRRFYLVRSP